MKTSRLNENQVEDMEKIRRDLEIKWQILMNVDECDLEDLHSCGGDCDLCNGTGMVDCRFCAGTGFFTIGRTLMGKGKSCTICSGTGEEICKKCRGSGAIAKWVTNLGTTYTQ